MSLTKGVRFANLRAFTRAHFGDKGWEALCAALPNPDRAALRELTSSGWYDHALHARLVWALTQLGGGPAVAEQLGRFEAEQDLSGVQRWFLWLVSPAFAIRNMNIYWRRTEDTGHWTSQIQGDRVTAQLTGWGDVEPALCRYLQGYLARTLESMRERRGAPSAPIAVEHVRCRADGAPACEFTARFSPGDAASEERVAVLKTDLPDIASEIANYTDVEKLADAIINVLHRHFASSYVAVWQMSEQGLQCLRSYGEANKAIPHQFLLQAGGRAVGRIDIETFRGNTGVEMIGQLLPYFAVAMLAASVRPPPSSRGPLGKLDSPSADGPAARASETLAARVSSPSAEPRDALAPGDVIAGKYEIDSILGEGGMGIVFAARHKDLDRRVAVKVLRAQIARNKDAVARFLREARILSGIQSEHVVRVLDVGQIEDAAPFMVMEHLHGINLEAMVSSRGALPITEAVEYILQACEALAEAHGRGVVHRDLKPANLFLTHRADGSPLVKVLDFGISKVTSAGAAGSSGVITGTAEILGSPAYMSPEQLTCFKDVDQRTDIWALGVMLHQLLSGRFPFEAPAVPNIIAKILVQKPAPLRAHRPDAPPELEALILRCLEKDPLDRWKSIAPFVEGLGPFATSQGRLSIHRVVRTIYRIEELATTEPGDTQLAGTEQPSTTNLAPADQVEPGPPSDAIVTFDAVTVRAPTRPPPPTSAPIAPFAPLPAAAASSSPPGTESLGAVAGPRARAPFRWGGGSKRLAIVVWVVALFVVGFVVTAKRLRQDTSSAQPSATAAAVESGVKLAAPPASSVPLPASAPSAPQVKAPSAGAPRSRPPAPK